MRCADCLRVYRGRDGWLKCELEPHSHTGQSHELPEKVRRHLHTQRNEDLREYCPGFKSRHKRAMKNTTEVSKAILVRLYNSGYKAGHHDTVEGQYTDIFEIDMDSYHKDDVDEIIEGARRTKGL